MRAEPLAVCRVYRLVASLDGCLRGLIQRHHPLDDGAGDVGHGPVALVVGQDLLRERHEDGSVGDQEADRVDQVVGPEVVDRGLVDVEERVPPRDQDQRRRRGCGERVRGAQRPISLLRR